MNVSGRTTALFGATDNTPAPASSGKVRLDKYSTPMGGQYGHRMRPSSTRRARSLDSVSSDSKIDCCTSNLTVDYFFLPNSILVLDLY